MRSMKYNNTKYNACKQWVRMRWLFLLAIPLFTLISTTDLNASFNATEIAKCMIAKNPYSGSFDRWDYAWYCGGDMTSTERIEVQCKIDELSGKNFDADTFTDELCKCSSSDYNGGGMYDDDDSLGSLC
jgi:hypothetical protein